MRQIFSEKKTLLATAGALLLLLAAVYYLVSARPSLWHAVPSQAVLVVEFKGWLRSQHLIGQSPDAPWKAAFETGAFQTCRADMAMFQRIFPNVSALQKSLLKDPLLCAFALAEADSLHPLFLLQPGEGFDLERALQANPVTPKVFPANFHGHTLYTIWPTRRDPLVLCQLGEFLIFSRFSYRVEDAVVQLERRSSWWADRKHAEAFAPGSFLRIFVQAPALAEAWSGELDGPFAGFPDALAQNVAWAGLAWDGQTVQAVAETKGFLATMQTWGKPAAGTALHAVAPDNAALLATAHFERPDAFLTTWLGGQSADFERFVMPWFGGEMAWLVTEPLSQQLREDQFLLLAVQDSALALERLRDYGRQYGTRPQEAYQTYELFDFVNPALLSPLARQNPAFRNPVATLLGDFVVFAPSRAALEVLIDKYIVGQTLANQVDFAQMAQRAPAAGGNAGLVLNSNFFLLLSQNLLSKNAFEKHKKSLETLSGTGFSALHLRPDGSGRVVGQWSSQPIQGQRQQTAVLWKTPLVAAAATAPCPVETESGTCFLIQDVQNRLYCLDIGGNILWQRLMDGRLMSAVQAVRSKEKSGTHLAFNTRQHLWLLDEQGQNVGRFPLALRSPASNGVLAIDFDNSLTFNYFVACANGNVYGFDAYGAALPGWNPNAGVGDVRQPLCHFQQGGKDFVAALNRAGALHVFARNGQPRFPAQALNGKGFGPLQADAGPKSPRLVCFDQMGKAFVCGPDGDIFSLAVGKGSGSAKGVFAPLSGDARLDYAVLQGKNLRALGYQGSGLKTLFDVGLPLAQDTLFAVWDKRLGALNRSKRSIMLFDATGKAHPDFPLAGTTAFVMQPARPGASTAILLVGNGNQVYAYSVR
jgi:hypothetical protein